MKSTVCIIGSYRADKCKFDFERSDCDVWVFNEAISNHTYPRADAVFQIHPEPIWRNPQNRNDPGHYAWLKSQIEIPVYMQEVYPDVPASVKYPLEDVKALTRMEEHFLSSSVAQATGLAILQGYKRIEIWNVAMESNTEYQYQREGVAFWNGFARGRGITLFFEVPTFQCPVYGYDAMVALEYSAIENRLAEIIPEISRKTELYQNGQALMKAALQAFANGDNDEKHILPKIAEVVKLGQQLGAVDGARQENEKYKNKADTMRTNAGDFIFSRQEFESSAAQQQQTLKTHRANMAGLGGQLSLVHKEILSAAKGSPKRDRLIKSYVDILTSYLQINNLIGVFTGAMQENFRYMGILDKGIRAAGGEKSEMVLLESMRQNAERQ